MNIEPRLDPVQGVPTRDLRFAGALVGSMVIGIAAAVLAVFIAAVPGLVAVRPAGIMLVTIVASAAAIGWVFRDDDQGHR